MFQGAWEEQARAYRGTGKYENVATGSVAPHEVPHFPFAHQTAVIWLAYASSAYLAGHLSGDSIEPAASVGVGPNGINPDSFLTEQAYWTCSTGPPGLPDRAAYLDNGIIGWKGRQPLRWPEPLDKGFTNTVYEVLEWTSLGSLELPVAARMRTFTPSWHETGGRLVLEMRPFEYEVRATNVTPRMLHSGVFRPNIPGETRIDDQRFTTAETKSGFDYDDKQGRWLTDREAQVLPEYRLALARYSAMKAGTRRVSRWVVCGILAVLMAWPLANLWHRKAGH
jgi:hypothetical protein